MADQAHVSTLLNGTDAWNSWRRENAAVVPSFRFAQLTNLQSKNALLDNACFETAKLSGADFEGAVLRNANLADSRLNDCNFRNADLTGASLDYADCSGACLDGTVLDYANLEHVTNLTQSQIEVAKGNEATKLPTGLTRPDSWFARQKQKGTAIALPPALLTNGKLGRHAGAGKEKGSWLRNVLRGSVVGVILAGGVFVSILILRPGLIDPYTEIDLPKPVDAKSEDESGENWRVNPNRLWRFIQLKTIRSEESPALPPGNNVKDEPIGLFVNLEKKVPLTVRLGQWVPVWVRLDTESESIVGDNGGRVAVTFVDAEDYVLNPQRTTIQLKSPTPTIIIDLEPAHPIDIVRQLPGLVTSAPAISTFLQADPAIEMQRAEEVELNPTIPADNQSFLRLDEPAAVTIIGPSGRDDLAPEQGYATIVVATSSYEDGAIGGFLSKQVFEDRSPLEEVLIKQAYVVQSTLPTSSQMEVLVVEGQGKVQRPSESSQLPIVDALDVVLKEKTGVDAIKPDEKAAKLSVEKPPSALAEEKPTKSITVTGPLGSKIFKVIKGTDQPPFAGTSNQ